MNIRKPLLAVALTALAGTAFAATQATPAAPAAAAKPAASAPANARVAKHQATVKKEDAKADKTATAAPAKH